MQLNLRDRADLIASGSSRGQKQLPAKTIFAPLQAGEKTLLKSQRSGLGNELVVGNCATLPTKNNIMALLTNNFSLGFQLF